MSAQTNLTLLLRGMKPLLQDDTFLFVTLPAGTALPPGLMPRMTFQESEGLTLIVTRDEAHGHGLQGIFPCRMITLSVHSSLEAVGFMATVATELARAGIGVNPVAAFNHDHLFVPEDRADEAVEILNRLAHKT